MKRKTTRIAVLVLALLLVGGLASVSAAAPANSSQNVWQQGMAQCRQGAQTALNAVSKLTGLSVDEIRTQRLEGKSLQSIAESKGISEQTLTNEVIAERKAALEQLKADGKITDAQYQTCINNMETRIKANVERNSTGFAGRPGNGMRGGRGGGQCGGLGGGGMQRGLNCPMASASTN